MREVLRGTLKRSLAGIAVEDRLGAAWTVACGRAMAEHGEVVGYVDGRVQVAVADAVWMRQMSQMRGVLAAEMARIAGVPIAGIDFEWKRQ